MKDITLDQLLKDMGKAMRDKDKADKAIYNAELKKRKAHLEYVYLQGLLRNREFILE